MKVIDLYQNIFDLEYDIYDNIAKTTITTANKETIVNSQENNKWGETTKSIDEYKNQTLQTFNYLNQITQIQYPNALTENFAYNNDLMQNSISSILRL